MENHGSEQPSHQSWLGITSFSLSVLFGLGLFALFVIVGTMEAQSVGGVDEESPVAIALRLLMFGCLFGELVAGGLGIAGLFERNKVKTFSVLGLAFSVVAFVLFVGMMMIGLTIG
ncbi:MAG: hypothetical protein AAGB34_04970 [Planctomycetota bacterium]